MDKLEFTKRNNCNVAHAIALWQITTRISTNIRKIKRFFPNEKDILKKLKHDLVHYYFCSLKSKYLPIKSKFSLTFKAINFFDIHGGVYGQQY